jgi:hypothetical protein
MWHVSGRREMYIEFFMGKVKERVHVKGLSIHGRIALKWILINRMGECALYYSGSGIVDLWVP